MRKFTAGLLLALVTLLVLPGVAPALETPKGNAFALAKGQTLDDDLFYAGENATIDGTINGDVVLLAETITVNGTINGTLVAAGSRIFLPGTVTGTVIAAGDTISVDGSVGRSLATASRSATVSERATVGGTWAGAAESLTLQGRLERGAALAASRIDITGRIGRDLRAASEDLSFGPGARVPGKITVWSSADPHINSGANVGPVTRLTPPDERAYRSRPWFTSPWVIALKFGGFVVVGLAVLALFPALRTGFPAVVQAKPWQAPLAGFLGLVALPIAAVLAMITLIGLPIGLLTLVLYPVAIYLGQIFVSWTVGRLAADRTPALKGQPWPVVLLMGALVTTLLSELPYVGWIFGAAFVFYGLGGIWHLITEREQAA